MSATPATQAQETWWQHFLSQFYLRGFGDAKKRIRRYERDGQQQHSTVAIRGIAADVGFYTLIDKQGNRSQAADDFITRLENESALALKRVTRSFPPSVADRGTIADFIAVQMLRTPEPRREHDLMAEKLVQILNDEGAAESLLSAVSLPSVEEQILIMLRVAPAIAAALSAKVWILARACDSSFITSDSPVALWSKHVEGRLTGIGVENAEEVHFPVDRKHALVLMQPGNGPEGVLMLSPDRVHSANRMYAHEAHRWIFQHPADDILDSGVLPAERRPLMEINQQPIFDTN